MHNKIFILLVLFWVTPSISSEVVFASKELSSIYIEPRSDSPMIYPIEIGKELIVKQSKGDWVNVLDQKTGLMGWIQKDFTSSEKPTGVSKKKDYKSSFKIFRGKVLEMSKSIKEAISIDTFLDVRHLGGAAAVIIADNDWFKGRRHANQAFQVYDLWRNQNQSPSFLSFKNEDDQEQFIILSGPHRPRYLKSSK